MTLPPTEYSKAIHTMKPGMVNSFSPIKKLNPPDIIHKMPTKLPSVTNASSKPRLSSTVLAVNICMSS